MTSIVTLFAIVVAVFNQHVSAQFSGRFPGLGALMSGSPFGVMNQQQQQQQQRRAYRTCIGQTAAGDEMRVSFQGSPQRQSLYPNAARNDISITAKITSGSIAGQFQLVTTEYGRIDGMCESASLGNILTNSQNLRQRNFRFFNLPIPPKTIGLVGTSFNLVPGKTVSIRDNINSELNLDLIAGAGMALCPLQQIVNNRCIDMISLCCAISRDNRPANVQLPSHGLIGGRRAAFGNSFNGVMNGMAMGNVGMGNINAGMQINGGMNGGMNGGNMVGQVGGMAGNLQG